MKDLPEWLKLVKGDMDGDDDEPVDLMLTEKIGYDPAKMEGISSTRFGMVLGSIRKTKVINLLINTLGGDYDAGTAIHNMVMARGNVNTVVIGFAASMGAIIAQAGAKRKMMPGTMMILHPVQGGGSGSYQDIEQAAEVTKQAHNSIVNLLSNRTGQSKKKIAEMMGKVTAMDPNEAKDLGFCDEVIESNDAWNDLSKEANLQPRNLLDFVRHLTGSFSGRTADDNIKPPQEDNRNKVMKTLVASLAKFKLLPSADLTDEPAIVTNFENNFAALGVEQLRNENASLKQRVQKFEDAQKLRVTNAVQRAIDSKLVKAERKDALISMGTQDESQLENYLIDLEEVRKQSGGQPQARRGAPPVPPSGSDDGNEETRLRNELTSDDCSPSRRVEISRRLRDLRGHVSLFSGQAEKKATN